MLSATLRFVPFLAVDSKFGKALLLFLVYSTYGVCGWRLEVGGHAKLTQNVVDFRNFTPRDASVLKGEPNESNVYSRVEGVSSMISVHQAENRQLNVSSQKTNDIREQEASTGAADLNVPESTNLKVPKSTTPHLDHIELGLRKLAPEAEGIIWGRTEGNALRNRGSSWLLHTPDCFDDPHPNANCGEKTSPGAHALATTIEEDIARATKWVDIVSMFDYVGHPNYGFFNGIFHEAIVKGIKRARRPDPVGYRDITIRIFLGVPPTKNLTSAAGKTYLAQLEKDLGSPRDLRIGLASVTTMHLFSWNHGKIVAVDAVSAIVGGHNLWDSAYNSKHPIVDVSMRAEGPASASAHRLADLFWAFACDNAAAHSTKVALSKSTALGKECPSTFNTRLPSPTPGTTSVLAMGSLAFGLEPLDSSLEGAVEPANDKEACIYSQRKDYYNDDARWSVDNPDQYGLALLVESAKESVFIAQQDLIWAPFKFGMTVVQNSAYDARLFNILAEKLMNQVSVTIVLSTPNEGVNKTGGYTLMQYIQQISDILLRKLKERVHNDDEAKRVLCKFLKLAAVRIAKDMPTWADGMSMILHSKLVSVDDAAFYIGSKNLYPSLLQEFGFVVEDLHAAAALKREFLGKLWQFSKEAASIDADAGRCELDTPGAGSGLESWSGRGFWSGGASAVLGKIAKAAKSVKLAP